MAEQRKDARREPREEHEREAEPEGAARDTKDSREDEGWSQPESSAQKQHPGSPPEQIPEEG